MRASYLEVTEETNALDYLREAQRHIAEAESRPMAWKWVAICLHGALYGFAICAVKGTNPARVIRAIRSGQERLIVFDEALRRAQDPTWMGQYTFSRVLELSASQKRSIRLLKDKLRNTFAHYIPLSWSLELHGMPQLTLDVLEVIEFLALKSGNVWPLQGDQQRTRVSTLLSEARRVLVESQLYEESQLLNASA
jgi:hypothetical protein